MKGRGERECGERGKERETSEEYKEDRIVVKE